uniref:Uncharacterized protein n=1 Tax=Setaria viridis TaxID=4556 RepID=A0A4U6TPB1_SETVI|nr:hypothetical protein SEVIR_7G005300v2 [Setaria viridis]
MSATSPKFPSYISARLAIIFPKFRCVQVSKISSYLDTSCSEGIFGGIFLVALLLFLPNPCEVLGC